jgi:hypothetical protein
MARAIWAESGSITGANGTFSRRHFRFEEEGITNTIEESRRRAYFMPIARPKKRGAQDAGGSHLSIDCGDITTSWQSSRPDS